MGWRLIPSNLLGRCTVVEVIVTADAVGVTRCTFSVLDEDAPIGAVIQGLAAASKRLVAEAVRLAENYKIPITMTPQGDIIPGKPPGDNLDSPGL